PNGSTIKQMNSVTRDFENYLQQFNQIEIFTTLIMNANEARIEITFKKECGAVFPEYLKQLVQTKANDAGAADFQIYGVGQGYNNKTETNRYDMGITVRGYNYEQLFVYANQVKEALKQFNRVGEVVITAQDRWSYKTYYEYFIRLTNSEMAAFEARKDKITRYLNNNTDHPVNVGNIEVEGRIMPVVAYNRKDRLLMVWEMMNEPVLLSQAHFIRLGNMAAIEKEKISENIIKEDQEYVLHVFYQFIGENELGREIQETVVDTMENQLPFGYKCYASDGSQLVKKNISYKYFWLILLVLLIIYMLCSILLESMLQPLAVIAMIPFSFIGVFIIFYVAQLNFDEGGYAALLMLSGIVTNAALYIINDINRLARAQGKKSPDLRKIYLKAFDAKIMPTLITNLSAILSMLPFMIRNDDKGFWYTMSLGTLGGLLFSIVGVYFFLPVFFGRKNKLSAIYNLNNKKD
ncbi:MAG TPA: efflux RND transporter permease subunit, partial [Niastella sp.]